MGDDQPQAARNCREAVSCHTVYVTETHPPNFDAKTWEPLFSKSRNFKDSRYVDLRRGITADSDDFGVFWRDTEDPAPLCTVEEVEDFCQNVDMENFESIAGTEGQPRRAWLDDRSSSHPTSNGRVRKYQNPLTAAGLYQLLKIPVWEGCVRESFNANLAWISDLATQFNLMQTDV